MDPLTSKDDLLQWDSGPNLLESVWRHRWLVLLATALIGLATFAASHLQSTLYEAEARLLLSEPGTSGLFEGGPNPNLDRNRFVRNQAEAANSLQVATRASEILEGRLTPEQIQEAVEAVPDQEVDVLTLRARAPTPEAAVLLADTVAEAHQQLGMEKVQTNAAEAIAELDEAKAELQARVDALEASLTEHEQAVAAAAAAELSPPAAPPGHASRQAERDARLTELLTLDSRANQIAVDAALYGSGVEIFQGAALPESPAQPQPLRNGAAAAVIGLFLSGAIAWRRAEFTQSADRAQDPAPVLRAPLLGQVPDFKSAGVTGADPTRTAPHSAAAEAYQLIVAAMQYALGQSDARTVLITSARTGDGKTVSALNLAVAAACDGRRVLIADGDGRARGLTTLVDVAPSPGLTDLATPSMPFEGCVASLSTPGEEIGIVPSGSEPNDIAGFFRTPGFRKAMDRIRERADLVIIDTPPLLSVSDTSTIAGQVDGIVLVVGSGTPLSVLEEVRQRLDFVGTPVLGYLFNRASSRGSGYGYGYGYGYGTSSKDRDRKTSKSSNGKAPAPVGAERGRAPDRH